MKNLRLLFLACVVLGVSAGGWLSGLATNPTQLVTLGVFAMVISTTLFYWERRVAAAFLGVSILISTHAMTLASILKATELDIIFFLIGMMIIVGVLKDLGFLTWVIQSIISRKKMNGISFSVILCVLSAVLASVVDEVSSIVVVLALVFQVCATLKLRPHPFVLMAVMATNIGSSATMLGNPVGIFIGNKAGLTFAQFLVGATPVAIVSLSVALAIVVFWFRKDIHLMTERMNEHRQRHSGLGPAIKIPYKTGLAILLTTVVVIAFHHQIEHLLALGGVENKNAFLILTPLVMSSILMIWRPNRARHYVEHDVEWWTLLFFMLLFAIAGSLNEQGITQNLADKLASSVEGGPKGMIPFVILIASLGSAFVDNIVFVAAFTPVIQALVARSADFSVLWWALLFGACFGGNITVVGSTANIVASGLLEKHGHHPIKFLVWIKIGACVGLVTGLVAWLMLTVLPSPMPQGAEAPAPAQSGEMEFPDLSPNT
ncbi:MAG: anion permease [Kiritimatiellae bacterium]|nr:anion permease [Kiritimatiellia bacterium]